ncbi:multicomponent Na+:H+ antiporter subunit G [Kineococcus xinjiangensis]|uniref:Multicomponent Na+:H+ antiporter subunit G n=1 Tax=Kineococcus xinjiangensis TaxID=512762 RepID=A0A2S6IGX7_9ACTN|nr:monovalent cation/H(+) antiporter subunit G [Kineococcus xinjiangensis]PPK93410.1 multicomponent Na+:H+ antiporter subunit G [Kineococcus xinjiangensis]
MSAVLDVLAAVLLLSGVGLTLLAGIGLLRFPDALTRMHAQTKPAVLGLLLVLAGAALDTRSAGLSATILLVAVFQLITSPVGAHAIGRAAYRNGDADLSLLVRDDLAGRDPADGPVDGGRGPAGG